MPIHLSASLLTPVNNDASYCQLCHTALNELSSLWLNSRETIFAVKEVHLQNDLPRVIRWSRTVLLKLPQDNHHV